MKKLSHHILLVYLPIAYCLLPIDFAFAQSAPAIEWQKSLGGSDWETGQSIQLTTDGGFIVAGRSASNDGDVSGSHGNNDYWVVKLDNTGNLQWQKCLGGSIGDFGESIQQTTDGGYIVAGGARSYDGDVSGNHGGFDYWVVKLDVTGNLQWQKCLGGSSDDTAESIQQSNDGGYIVVGTASSTDGDVSCNHGYADIFVAKLNSTGSLQWQKCLGGSDVEEAESIQKTSDGGYIITGTTWSNDGDVNGNHGGPDCWVVKLDSIGNLQWQKCLGGSNIDFGNCIQQTADGGFILAGETASNDGDVSGNHGTVDYWVAKLDNTGNVQWQKCLGGSSVEAAHSIMQTSTGDYFVSGWTTSNDGDVSGWHGNQDIWAVMLDGSGNLQWQKCLGGSSQDASWAEANLQTTDGGYVVVGAASSTNGDVSGNHGFLDYWVVKLQGSCQAPDIPIVNAAPEIICEGDAVTLTITSGNLNGATAWKWYTGSCGGTLVGTGVSIMVNPSVTTIYYVRGEGGCAGNGPCANKMVTVNPYPDPSIQHAFSSPCYFTDHIFRPLASSIPGASYQWSFGANALPASATGYGPHFVQYTAAGSKNVQLVIYPNAPGAQCPDSSTINFVIANCPGQIIGKVLDDAGNPIVNVNVKLFVDADANGIPDSTGPIRNVFTGGTGVFAMATLIPNNYLIIQTQPVSWISLDDGDATPDGDVLANIDSLDNLIPNSISINKIDSNNVFIETGAPGIISGNVFDDLDQDEVPDSGEGILNVSIQLFADSNANGIADAGTPIASTTTSSTGVYTLLNITPGHYVLVETTPVTYISIKDVDASPDGDATPNTNMNNDTLPVTVSNAESDSDNYFIDGTACSLLVANTNDGGYGSFRHAAGCAVDGDTIHFHSNLSGEVIEINSGPIEFDIHAVVLSDLSPRVSIQSSIQDLFIILPDAWMEFHHINIVSGLGTPGSGAAFENHGDLTFYDVEIFKHPNLNSGAYLIKSYPLATTTMNGVVQVKN